LSEHGRDAARHCIRTLPSKRVQCAAVERRIRSNDRECGVVRAELRSSGRCAQHFRCVRKLTGGMTCARDDRTVGGKHIPKGIYHGEGANNERAELHSEGTHAAWH